jgi:hypothetical protein
LYGLPSSQKIAADSAYISMLTRFNATHHFAAALIVQAKQDADTTTLTDYLSKMKPFTLNLFNKNEAIASIMLQFYSNPQRSQMTAKKLFDKLNFYLQNDRQSFQFWGLGGYYLIAKFHCGKPCRMAGNGFENQSAPNVLQTLFKPDHAWWADDFAFVQVALSAWAADPVVVEYLARIKQDQQRFKQMQGL